MKKSVFGVIGISIIAVMAYFIIVSSDGDDSKGNKTLNIRELVNDYSIGAKTAEAASITSEQLVVTNSDGESTYALPEDDFFVSIAPYIEETHPCAIHSLTGCRGELANQNFDVHIEDTEGNIYLDEVMTSQANGFIDLWLPRDKTYHVTIEQDGKKVESEIATFVSDDTCITTMQLMDK
ncbi:MULTISPECIES: CueP family metal-binding protein [Paraliobacillus]|uniref:CueP family metal-binding protein n=1 Tax=Paraliobacillus TaxID=200903 RepID=UPI000DD367CD|nr:MULTISPECIES: CueP family metal-binding protein [Paraliobacillus]